MTIIKDRQKYKIYINEIPVLLISSNDFNISDYKTPLVMCAKYTGKPKHLLHYIDMCEKNPKIDQLVMHFDDFNELKKDFKSIYTDVEAGGGLIENEEGEFLFIYRRGFWDLPKGKLEKNETKRETAEREVIEETGIAKVDLIQKICVTRHTFKNRSGVRNIKISHWYHMQAKKQKLKPQKSEDILRAEWIKLEDFKQHYKPVYASILEVIDQFEILKSNNLDSQMDPA